MSAAERPLVSVLVASEDSVPEAGSDSLQIEVLPVEVEPAAGGAVPSPAALSCARGELVVYLPPGDVLLADALPSLIEALRAQPLACFAYPAFHLLDVRGEISQTVVPEELDLLEMVRWQYSPVGPGAIFRREPALEALAGEPPPPALAELAFWMRMAARGGTRRIAEPLAGRRLDAPRPMPAGIEGAREMLDLFELLVAELDLPAEAEPAIRSGGRSACILAAAQCDAAINDPGERFFIADRFGELPADGQGDLLAETALLETRAVNLEQRLSRQRAVLPALEAIVASREQVLRDGRPPPPGLGRRLAGRLRGRAGG